jgi:3-dehydroquinate dehydratase-2
MKIQIINGPNLNMLGIREPAVYGKGSFEDFLEKLKVEFTDIGLSYFQSNIEGELVGKLQQCRGTVDAVILNAGGYTHTSVAIHDAIAAAELPVLEVHISNIYARETFRHQNVISSNCIGMITGLGLEGYRLGIIYFMEKFANGKG